MPVHKIVPNYWSLVIPKVRDQRGDSGGRRHGARGPSATAAWTPKVPYTRFACTSAIRLFKCLLQDCQSLDPTFKQLAVRHPIFGKLRGVLQHSIDGIYLMRSRYDGFG